MACEVLCRLGVGARSSRMSSISLPVIDDCAQRLSCSMNVHPFTHVAHFLSFDLPLAFYHYCTLCVTTLFLQIMSLLSWVF